jgi:hypothetical protein
MRGVKLFSWTSLIPLIFYFIRHCPEELWNSVGEPGWTIANLSAEAKSASR